MLVRRWLSPLSLGLALSLAACRLSTSPCRHYPIGKSPEKKILQVPADGIRQRVNAVAPEFAIHILEAADEIEDVAPCVWPARGGAKVGAAAERTRIVNETSTSRIEHRT